MILINAFNKLKNAFFFNDFYYLINNFSALFVGYDAIYYPIVGVVSTAVHGLMMMLLPTSIALVAGLKLFDIKYTEWFKKIWLYLLEALVVLILVAIIVAIIL